MAKFVKWIGGGLGWAFGGPIGGLIGFALGSLVDNAQFIVASDKRTHGGDFTASLLVLAAAVMKADGKILKSELDYIKNFFIDQIGAAQTQEKMLLLRDIVSQEIPIPAVCSQIRVHMDYSSRLMLLQFLFGIAAADVQIHASELNLISQISVLLGINQNDFESIKAMFVKSSTNNYKILEIEEDSSDDEVKKAYRRMAMKYHPDKVHHLGEEYHKAAGEKFKKVNEAYDSIKKIRGLV